jgi:hypothetical protein
MFNRLIEGTPYTGVPFFLSCGTAHALATA